MSRRRIIARELSPEMHGPWNFATVSEQFLISEGYHYEFAVFDGDLWVRTGVTKCETAAAVESYVSSGVSYAEWLSGVTV